MSINTSINAQKKILEAAIALLPQCDLSPSLLEKSSENAGFSPLFYHTVFMDGMPEFIRYVHEQLDQEMIESIKDTPLATLPIRERIFCLVQARLVIMSKNKEAYRKLYYFTTQPSNFLSGTHYTWKTMDIIWRLAGDRSTDFNYYTKRSLLLAVYSSTFLYWLQDHSTNHHLSWDFLRRRINNVLAIGSYKQKLKRFFS